MERVQTRTGRLPVVVVVPHGHPEDDVNTDLVGDVLATDLNASAVINTGWRRATTPATSSGLANLNDLRQCRQQPMRREFLDPLLGLVQSITERFNRCHVIHVHGMADLVREKTGSAVDLVLGYGAGNPPSYSCDLTYKDALVTRLTGEGLVVFQGKPGGAYAAWRADNLNQLFRHHRPDLRVQSVQLEIVNALRRTTDDAVRTGLRLAKALDKFLHTATTFARGLNVPEY